MANLNPNVAHAKGTLSRNSSSSSLSSCKNAPVKKKQRIEIDIPKSIFELGDPDSHRAVVLDNQELFKEVQKNLINALDDYTKKNSLKHEYKKPINKQQNSYRLLNDKNVTETFELSSQYFAYIRRSFKESSFKSYNGLHTDAAPLSCDKHQNYVILIPLLDYDLSGKGNHNLTPQSTVTLPHKFRNNMTQVREKSANRKALVYEPCKEIEKYLVSEALTQGTALIFRTATEAGSEDDGKSVIHASPNIPKDFARVFVVCYANKK